MKTKTLSRFFTDTAHKTILITAAILCVCSSCWLVVSSQKHINREMQLLAEQKSNIIQLSAENLEETIRGIVFNETLQQQLAMGFNGEIVNATTARIAMNETVSSLALFFPQAENVIVYNTEGEVVGSKYEISDKNSPRYLSEEDRKLLEQNGNILYWISDSGRTTQWSGSNAYISSIASEIRAYKDYGQQRINTLLGYLVVDYNCSDWEILLQTQQEDYQIFLINDDGCIITGNRNEKIGQTVPELRALSPGSAEVVRIEGKWMIAACRKLSVSNAELRCITMVPYVHIYEETFFAIMLLVLLCGGLLVAMLLVIQRKAEKIVSVFDKMNRDFESMEQGRWELEAFSPCGVIELDHVAICLHHMASRMEQLVYELYEAELHKQMLQAEYREAEYDNLKAQLNPHFLYNTLDTINWMALSHGEEDIAQMILMLGKLFRINLNQDNQTSTVRQEIERVDLFVQLEQKRFGSRLQYMVEADEDVLSCMIPSLMLQLMVENAINHGIASVCYDGKIRVRVAIELPMISVSVCDNGVGMDEGKLAELREAWNTISGGILDLKDGTRSIGLRNIMKRLQLLYPGRAEFSISSDEYGTNVCFRYPADVAAEQTDH